MTTIRCNGICYTPQGLPDAAAVVTFQQLGKASDGICSSALIEAACDADGNLLDPNDGAVGIRLISGVQYRAHRGSGAPASASDWITFTPTGSDPFALPPMLGRDHD